MKFLNKVILDLKSKISDLDNVILVLPGKRPVVFIKKILKDEGYTGFLPEFITIEDCITDISGKTSISGISIWLYAFNLYKNIFPEENFDNFIKWFPTLQKDWDDMMKFSESDTKILEYMLDEERIRNWGENLGEDTPRKRNLDFWKKMNVFLPKLKEQLLSEDLATSGMIHQIAKEIIKDYAKKTQKKYIFIGFNAFTPVEEILVKSLLENAKAECYFQGDEYYINDEKQEAGAFLRKHKQWKEFNTHRPFQWIENEFIKEKNINVYEVSGNITQTKILPEIFDKIESKTLEDTALVLLDENLLPATLDALNSVEKLNITMGFPLKNLDFSIAIKNIFYIHKNLAKNSKNYYYNDILSILENLPEIEGDKQLITNFIFEIKDKNKIYISPANLKQMLGELSYYYLFEKQENTKVLLKNLIRFCEDIKYKIKDDIIFENIAHFEKSFKIIENQILQYNFDINIDSLEVLINQIINTETIDFQGEPLEGLQVMGLLETRLLNFKNVIMLSVNEGKLPLGNTQNTYLPFDVRRKFDMHTFLENDSIYAYHFYRLLQNAENVFLMYNGLSSGVNTGEKSRFITQIELESPHKIQEIIIENQSEPIIEKGIQIEKTNSVMEKLNLWKERVSASHLTAYLYNPIQFYLNYVLKTKEINDIEEELSQRNYGNLVHKSLEYLYEPIIGKILKTSDLELMISKIEEAMDYAVQQMNHQLEFYQKGMNYIHKSLAKKVVTKILDYDLNLVKEGNALEIIGIEKKIENIDFVIDDSGDKVSFLGYIDRLDRLNGVVRVIDYKTAKSKNLTIKISDKNRENILMSDDYKQALQLSIYLYYLSKSEYATMPYEAGIWSFAEVNKGVKPLQIIDGDYTDAMLSVKNLILEILNPEIPFVEIEK